MATAEPKAICERIGKRMRERRKDLGISLDRLAAMTELSKTGLWQIEQGQNEPRAGTIVRLCNALRLSAADLLGVEEDQ